MGRIFEKLRHLLFGCKFNDPNAGYFELGCSCGRTITFKEWWHMNKDALK